MIILHGFGPRFGLPEASPFVTKTEIHLKMAGLAYRKQISSPSASPKGQLPFIEDHDESIADSVFIRKHIEQKYGFDFDKILNAAERAQSWATERMIENHLNTATTYGRWLLPENFAKGPARFADAAPQDMREKLRADMLGRVKDTMQAVGIARHAPDEIVELGCRSLTSLSMLLGDRPYMMGKTISGLDASAFGALAGLLTPFFDFPLQRQAETFGNLNDYVDRMMTEYYPDHPWRE